MSLAAFDGAQLSAEIDHLMSEARREFATAAVDADALAFRTSVDMRYPGQAFELEVDIDEADLRSVSTIAAKFHDRHRDRYGHAAEDEWPEIVVLRVQAVIPQSAGVTRYVPPKSPSSFEILELDLEGGRRPVSFVQRPQLTAEQTVSGPAVIEEDASTVWVPVGWQAYLDDFGHLRLEPAK
jgi:N-methylhydantoinase A/oxoprolinase/acetone carboxylase beta subunit